MNLNPDVGGSKQSVTLKGSCCCKTLKYYLKLQNIDDARTTLCHCANCKKAFGGVFGLTAKIPIQSFRYESGSEKPTVRLIKKPGP